MKPMKVRSLENKDVITKFYHIRMALPDTRRSKNRGHDQIKTVNLFPVVTVCVKYIPEENAWSRGVSICNMVDENASRRSKRAGRRIAEERARHALEYNRTHLKIEKHERFPVEVQDFLRENGIYNMLQVGPKLTSKECELLDLIPVGTVYLPPARDQKARGLLGRAWDRVRGFWKSLEDDPYPLGL
jgi:hypothetical protein